MDTTNIPPSNCARNSEKYIKEVFMNKEIIPNNSMNIGSKLNSLLRLTFIIFLILVIMNNKFSLLFLPLAIIVNLIFYFIYKNKYE